MNSVRIIERRVAFTFSHIPKVQQSRAITAFRSIGAPSTRQLCYSYRPRINRAQRLYPRNPNTESVGTRRYKSTKQTLNPTPNLGSPEPAPSLSQRLKQLSREYGWTAVGVYLLLSALDFPFCFLAVRALGTERIGQWEHAVIQFFKSIIDIPFPGLIKDTGEGTADTAEQAQAAVREGGIAPDSELSQAQEASSESDATIWTQLALAYAIHKFFIFIRVPLTAAILPKVVKTLRGWGWNIGKKSPKSKP